jgi:hypothetical protein
VVLLARSTDTFRRLARDAPRPGEVCVDVGSAHGDATKRMAKAVGSEANVTGLDVSPDFVRLSGAKYPGITFERLDVLEDTAFFADILAKKSPDCVFVDIGGVRAAEALVRALPVIAGGRNANGKRPRLVAVKCEALAEKAIETCLKALNGEGPIVRLPESFWLSVCASEVKAARNRSSHKSKSTSRNAAPASLAFARYPLRYPKKVFVSKSSSGEGALEVEICRFHNYAEAGCLRLKQGTCCLNHTACHWCGKEGHKASACAEAAEAAKSAGTAGLGAGGAADARPERRHVRRNLRSHRRRFLRNLRVRLLRGRSEPRADGRGGRASVPGDVDVVARAASERAARLARRRRRGKRRVRRRRRRRAKQPARRGGVAGRRNPRRRFRIIMGTPRVRLRSSPRRRRVRHRRLGYLLDRRLGRRRLVYRRGGRAHPRRRVFFLRRFLRVRRFESRPAIVERRSRVGSERRRLEIAVALASPFIDAAKTARRRGSARRAALRVRRANERRPERRADGFRGDVSGSEYVGRRCTRCRFVVFIRFISRVETRVPSSRGRRVRVRLRRRRRPTRRRGVRVDLGRVLRRVREGGSHDAFESEPDRQARAEKRAKPRVSPRWREARPRTTPSPRGTPRGRRRAPRRRRKKPASRGPARRLAVCGGTTPTTTPTRF